MLYEIRRLNGGKWVYLLRFNYGSNTSVHEKLISEDGSQSEIVLSDCV